MASPRITLTIHEVSTLLAIAAATSPDDFADEEALAAIHKARAFTDRTGGGPYRLRIIPN